MKITSTQLVVGVCLTAFGVAAGVIGYADYRNKQTDQRIAEIMHNAEVSGIVSKQYNWGWAPE